jgi:hypothetical protein
LSKTGLLGALGSGDLVWHRHVHVDVPPDASVLYSLNPKQRRRTG